MSQLEGKTAVVTGGGSGMGLAIANAFAEAGAKTIIAGRRESVLKEAADANPSLLYRSLDVSDRDDVNAFFAWAEETLGQIDILVNSAGTNIKTRAMHEMTPDQWDQVMAINATGAYNCMYAVLPAMRERKDGLIVNISSIAGKRASDLGGIVYCASKFAMTALGTAVGLEDASNGIRVTNIYPGEVDTPILLNRKVVPDAEHRSKICQAEDVAHVVMSVVTLPPRAHVPELIIKPTLQFYS